MLFNSQVFLLLFLPVTLAGFVAIWSRSGQKPALAWVVIASLVFYGYWNPPYVFILIGSVLCNFGLGRYLSGAPHVRRRMAALVLGITANLGLLGYYKYANFFVDSVNSMTGSGWDLEPIALPLAISFFTFQQIAFLVDAWRRKTHEYGFIPYTMFVTFFPQLIAGPIVRHEQIIHQFDLSPLRETFYENISKGLTLFTIGLFKKVVLADRFAAMATPVFDSALGGNTIDLVNGWMACSAYTLQLYFDFSGYTDMAIGLGLMFGYRLPINFNVPYRACSIQDFWQRWHITLSRFLRDYVYFSLGGNRYGFSRQLTAIFLTMLLGGLWHGAGWTYVIWGGMHGLGLVFHRCWQGLGFRLPRLVGWALTMLFVMFSFVLFRAESFAGAWEVASGMLGFNDIVTVGNEVDGRFWRLMAVGALIATVGPSSYQVAVERLRPAVWKAVLVSVVLVYLILETGSGGYSEFIYFQF
jgi:D-alanyl-lipoteichoic acid acyltransferase DltB (MBOAT superfamily)